MILSVVVTANSLPDRRRRRWAYVSHPVSARCSLFPLPAPQPHRSPRIDPLTEQPAAIVVFAARRAASAQSIFPLRSYYLRSYYLGAGRAIEVAKETASVVAGWDRDTSIWPLARNPLPLEHPNRGYAMTMTAGSSRRDTDSQLSEAGAWHGSPLGGRCSYRLAS